MHTTTLVTAPVETCFQHWSHLEFLMFHRSCFFHHQWVIKKEKNLSNKTIALKLRVFSIGFFCAFVHKLKQKLTKIILSFSNRQVFWKLILNKKSPTLLKKMYFSFWGKIAFVSNELFEKSFAQKLFKKTLFF